MTESGSLGERAPGTPPRSANDFYEGPDVAKLGFVMKYFVFAVGMV